MLLFVKYYHATCNKKIRARDPAKNIEGLRGICGVMTGGRTIHGNHRTDKYNKLDWLLSQPVCNPHDKAEH